MGCSLSTATAAPRLCPVQRILVGCLPPVSCCSSSTYHVKACHICMPNSSVHREECKPDACQVSWTAFHTHMLGGSCQQALEVSWSCRLGADEYLYVFHKIVF